MTAREDRFYRLAKAEKYRSRAAYKLIELQERYSLIGRESNVLEIGSSPGGWSQVISSITSGLILSVDIQPQERITGVDFIRGSVFSPSLHERISSYLIERKSECFDVIVSDAMAHTSGNTDIDHARSVEICDAVMKIASAFLCKNGKILLKQFQGDMTRNFMVRWSADFSYQKVSTVKATRRGSREIYIILARNS